MKNKIAFIFTGCFTAIVILWLFVTHSQRILFIIADMSDIPSHLHYFATENIFKIIKSNGCNDIVQHIEEGKNGELYDLYIHAIGVTGCNKSTTLLMNLYVKNQHDQNKHGTINRIIDSMGMSGNPDYEVFLQTFLKDHQQLAVQSSQYAIARSLYLLTGKLYPFEHRMKCMTVLQ